MTQLDPTLGKSNAIGPHDGRGRPKRIIAILTIGYAFLGIVWRGLQSKNDVAKPTNANNAAPPLAGTDQPPLNAQPPTKPVAREAGFFGKTWGVFRSAGAQWLEDKAPRLGAALAYYTVFSLAPLLIIVIAIAGFVFGAEAAQGQISGQIRNLVGEEGGKAIEAMVASANKPATGTLATVAGVVMLLFGAAGLFGQLQDALDTVWEVEPKPGQGVWAFVRARFLSFSMVLGTAFLLLVSLVVSSALTALNNVVVGPGTTILGHLFDLSITLLVVTLLFAMIYRYLPDAKVAWRDVWFGAGVTAVLFVLGKFLIGLYIGQTGAASAYGASGSMAVLLIWLYYSSQIFLFGAEITKAYANQFGSHIKPKENAVRTTPQDRAQQGIPKANH